jgi:hypothetical protein
MLIKIGLYMVDSLGLKKKFDMKQLTLNVNKQPGKQLELTNDHSDSLDFLNDKQHHLNAKSGHLILSSSAGSIIVLSSTLDITNVGNKNYHVRNSSGHLILSSSVGSRIVASGSLLVLSASVAVGGASVGTTGDYGQVILSNPLNQTDAVAGLNLRTASGWNVYLRTRQNASWLELTTGQGVLQHQWVATNYNLSGAITFLGGVSASIVAKDQHLILSSSIGSVVRISSSLGLHKVTTSTLPAGSDNLSGSMVWVSDSKQAAIYGPLGWTRVLTGTVVS